MLKKALNDERVHAIVAPVRRSLPRHPKLFAPVIDFDNMPENANWWRVDAVICALGTTMKKAGSKGAFCRVDFDYPLAVARLARQHGTPTFVLTSSVGANRSSRFFYYRVKGEIEHALEELGFESLTLVRPGLIGGQRDESRPLETVLRLVKTGLHSFLPKSSRINQADRIADELLKAAIHPKSGVHIISSEKMA